MDSKKRREVTFHRRAYRANELEDAVQKPEASALSSSGGTAAPAETSDDDLPVSSEQSDADNPWIAPPSYGEMGAPSPADSTFELDAERAHQSTTNSMVVLDAWYAAYGHPALAALLRRPDVARAITNLNEESDHPSEVVATESYPWRCICALNITAADGSRWLGTGWLAGPRLIITAGHCVYLHRHGGWVRQIEVVPGQNRDQRPYGSAMAASFRSVRGWAHKQQPDYDYGAVILPTDRAFGKLLGHFGYGSLDDVDLQGARINLAGYPSDQPPGTQWHHGRALDFITPRTLQYPIDTLGGQSGAPVWYLRNGARYVVGIHSIGNGGGNASVRINAPVFGNITAWNHEGS